MPSGGNGNDYVSGCTKLYAGPGDDTVFFDEGIDVVNPVNCETLNTPQE